MDLVSLRVALAAGLLLTTSTLVQAKDTVDADLVPLCTSGLKEGGDKALGLYEVGDGLLNANLANAKSAQDCLKATSGQLNLNIGNTSLNLSGVVQYRDIAGPQRRLVASTIDPVLCESYYPAADNLAFSLTNANGDLQGPSGLLRGVNTMSYSVQSGQFNPALSQAPNGSYIACASASAANVASAPVDANRVFSSRFEESADLVVEYLSTQGTPIDTLLQTVNTNGTYKVRISNRGEAAARGVRIREFVPKPAGLLTPNMNMDLASCVRDSDGGNCAGTDKTLREDVATILPGDSISYTLTRRVNGSAAVPATSGALTQVAAFVDPTLVTELNERDNRRSLRIGLVTNAVPVANNQTVTTAEDTPINIVLTGTDSDGGTLSYVIQSASNGVVGGTPPNVSFTPNADFNGAASFSFTVGDGLATSTPATISVNVTPVNDAPRVVSQLPDISRPEGALLDLHVGPSFADPENDAYTLSATGLPPGVNFFASSGTIGGQLSLQASGQYTITVTATENGTPANTVSDSFVLTVTNTNQDPTVATALPDRTDAEGATITSSLAANFTDGDVGDVLNFSVSGGSLPPGIQMSPTGQLSGSLSAVAANGSPYTITINAFDGEGGSVSDTFVWTVTPVNFAPVAVGTLPARNGTVGQLLNISGTIIRGGFSDPDGDTLTYSAVNLPAGVNISDTDGTIIGSPSAAGTYNVIVTATDGTLTVDQPFTLTIAP